MKLDVYVVEQSMSNLSFILSQHKQGRKYYALASSPLTTCQNWYDTRSDRLDVLHAIINKVVLLKCTKSNPNMCYPQQNSHNKQQHKTPMHPHPAPTEHQQNWQRPLRRCMAQLSGHPPCRSDHPDCVRLEITFYSCYIYQN